MATAQAANPAQIKSSRRAHQRQLTGRPPRWLPSSCHLGSRGPTGLARASAGVLRLQARGQWGEDEEEPWGRLTKGDPSQPSDTRCSFTIAILTQSAPLK